MSDFIEGSVKYEVAGGKNGHLTVGSGDHAEIESVNVVVTDIGSGVDSVVG